MALTFTPKTDTTLPIHAAGLSPDALAPLSLSEIERLPLHHGNQEMPLAELLKATGDAGDDRLIFSGDLSNFEYLAAEMRSGTVLVEGNVGRHLGSRMQGGELTVSGSADDWLGEAMRGGTIRVHRNAGAFVGGAPRGATRGMTGGAILVEGNAGNEVGYRMRRGIIAVGGDVGDLLGADMLAGTLLVQGACGLHPGLGMRRGTIVLLGGPPLGARTGFLEACVGLPTCLRLILRQLEQLGFPLVSDPRSKDYLQFSGDLLSLGRGEIFCPAIQHSGQA